MVPTGSSYSMPQLLTRKVRCMLAVAIHMFTVIQCACCPAGSPESFTIQVNRVRNAPLDLYFVMDQSLSMEGSLNTFKDVVNTLCKC